MGSQYRSQHEFVLVFKNPGAAHVNNIELGRFGRYRTNVWNYEGASSIRSDCRKDLAGHPSPKPVRLVADALLDATVPGDVVLDLFLGGGATLIAAEDAGRRCFGCELDPLYVDLAVRRWQELTGSDAIHEASGLTFNEIERRAGGAALDNLLSQ